MTSYNLQYTTNKELFKFIRDNNIKNEESLLIQIFTGINERVFIQNLLDNLNSVVPKAYIIGSTTDGEINGSVVSTLKCIISFSIFKHTQINSYICNQFEDYYEAGEKIASNLIQDNTKVIISFADGNNTNGEAYLNGINSINKNIIVSGGLSGDNSTFTNSIVFDNNTIFENSGIVGVSLNSNILKVYRDYSFHWVPVGFELEITKVENNRVYEINNRTAVDIYSHYLGKDIAEKLPATGIEFPLIINRDGINIARAAIAKNDDGSLIFAGNLHEGDKVKFGYGDKNAILNFADNNTKTFINKNIESFFIYSCMARRHFISNDIYREIEPFSSIAPTSGFFTYGEFFTTSKTELLNETMTILGLSENEDKTKDILFANTTTNSNANSEYYTSKALFHLLNKASIELEDSNTKQTKIYNKLYKIGKNLNETLSEEKLFNIALNFATKELQFEKCLIFTHNDSNGWFKVVKSIGYNTPKEKMIINIINLLLSGEVIEYLRITGEPIMHTQSNPDNKVSALTKSLFLEEAYIELFGGDIDLPYGVIIVGNSALNLNNFSRIGTDTMISLAMGNFISQFSNTLNNIIFYKAWENEKADLEKNISIRTKELEIQKNRFETIYETSRDGIAILDAQTTAFLETNQAFADMTGYTKSELKKISCLKLTYDVDLERSGKAIKRVLKDGYITNFIKDCKAKDGSRVTLHLSVSNLFDGTVLLSGKDITVQKQLEIDILKQKDKAEQASRLKSEFLANMSHEIRTPMNGILGMSHLILETNLNNKQKEYLEHIDNSAKNLLNIINDILDFSKIEAGKLNIEKINFDMKELISNIESIITIKTDEKGLDFNIKYNCSPDHICFGDSLRISQVLINLLGNAVKFTKFGKIELDIQRESKDKIRFIVSDTGIGLSKEHIDKLFQSFTQADGSTTRKYGGTGLGLSISKQLVELMGGKIWVESKIDVGSRFIFEIVLPKGNKIKIDKNKELDLNQINTLKGSNILLVEDNITNQKIILGLLEHNGINIDIANNGQESIDMFKLNQDKYELILMDLQMPIMSGIEATKIIRNMKKGKNIPIIALTANAMTEDVEKTKLAGMQEHLNKPIEVDKLFLTLLKYIDKKINSEKLSIINKNIIIPSFKNIDAKIGLSHMNNNNKLYLDVLNNFYENYKDLKLYELNSKEFKREIHTIKGLSANIGAMELNKITKELELTENKNLLYKFYEKLNFVLSELNILELSNKKENVTLLEIDDIKIKKLFVELEKALLSKRAKQYKPLLLKIEKYRLDVKKAETFSQIKKLANKYKIADAIKLMKKLN